MSKTILSRKVKIPNTGFGCLGKQSNALAFVKAWHSRHSGCLTAAGLVLTSLRNVREGEGIAHASHICGVKPTQLLWSLLTNWGMLTKPRLLKLFPLGGPFPLSTLFAGILGYLLIIVII